ncbi:hypothetical protein FOA43_001881 [Brettanomyces nanus]|uniref:Uncharacterized protein n=1 Tax=Eeniella nana TaxID=13502 RepID=A0A875RP43_EENNA|nr:uncharacterized protein FOA43_001881 [Brettanomyces nanus]QPG74550.1 hypothetical protein FOA43_001881 [Brettanomyces nanus]
MSTKSFISLIKELQEFSMASFRRRSKDVAKKENALLIYKRMQFKKAGEQLTPEQDKQLVKSVKARFGAQAPKSDTALLQFLNQNDLAPGYKRHLDDITLFLKSQRVYMELLERYNPGISMAQKDKVEKTAHRVGLQVPE